MIHLAQLLCPKRHCLVAVPFGGEPLEALAAVTEGVEEHLFKTGRANRWCGICGSKELHWETIKTPWETIEEALPLLKVGEAMQKLSREILDQEGQTFDSKRHRGN